MTVAHSSDKNAAEGLWSRKNAMDSSATEPSRKGTLECSRVSPAAATRSYETFAEHLSNTSFSCLLMLSFQDVCASMQPYTWYRQRLTLQA